MSQADTYISLGSNLGDRAGYLLLAVRGMLAAGLGVKRLSNIYETQAVGNTNQPAFLNMVAELSGATIFSPEQTMARLLRIEYALGRTRDLVMGPRTVDLDLLLCGDEQRNTELLVLPHPRFHQRRFVLVPLNELTPTLVHPILGRTISDLLEHTEDTSQVQLWRPSDAAVLDRNVSG